MVGKYGKNATDELKIKKVSRPRGGTAPSLYARFTSRCAACVLCAPCTHCDHATYGHTDYGRAD